MIFLRTEKVEIKDWVNGNCKFQGCRHNEDGACTHDDEDFIDAMFELVDKNGIHNDIFFQCTAIEVLNGVCEWCNQDMQPTTEKLPYGDTTVPYTLYECKNKNC